MLSSRQSVPASVAETGFNGPRYARWALAFVFACLLLTGIPTAQAAVVTTNEAGMDGIYSQASFGSTPIDIRFDSIVTLSNGALRTIDTQAKLDSLFAFNDLSSSNIVSMYFVDTLDWCTSFDTSIVGCASLPGNDIVVESAVAAGIFGTELASHELGHNLGLDHVVFPNLMNASLNGITTLTASQVATILASPLIQLDGGVRFVEIVPVLVTPLPSAGILFISAILVFLGVSRRMRSSG